MFEQRYLPYISLTSQLAVGVGKGLNNMCAGGGSLAAIEEQFMLQTHSHCHVTYYRKGLLLKSSLSNCISMLCVSTLLNCSMLALQLGVVSFSTQHVQPALVCLVCGILQIKHNADLNSWLP